MNSTIKGNALEDSIFKYFQDLISSGGFFGGMRSCQVFQKKGYYSKDRESDIIFDVAIEAYLSDASNYSLLFLIECKNYDHPVPVSDVEEFFAKVQQVGAANSKAILISSNSIQSGGLAFAKSKGMGIARYYNPGDIKWQLHRSSAFNPANSNNNNSSEVFPALTQENYKSNIFEFHFQTPKGYTNSITSFFEDLCIDLNTEDLAEIQWPATIGRHNLVPFLSKKDLEFQATRALDFIEYVRGTVDLHSLSQRHPAATGLQVKHTVVDTNETTGAPLGMIIFEPLSIEIFIYPERNTGRERFTFAHELAHLILGHGQYMRAEYTEEKDFQKSSQSIADEMDVFRMEYQANYLAACILMPLKSFRDNFMNSLRLLELRDKGFGPLFVDAQECNVKNYLAVTSVLMQLYGVSRMAATLRAESLGLLRDDRKSLLQKAGLPRSEDSLRWFRREPEE